MGEVRWTSVVTGFLVARLAEFVLEIVAEFALHLFLGGSSVAVAGSVAWAVIGLVIIVVAFGVGGYVATRGSKDGSYRDALVMAGLAIIIGLGFAVYRPVPLAWWMYAAEFALMVLAALAGVRVAAGLTSASSRTQEG